ncbi:MAG: carbohydrate-binding protein, partial [Thermodesulfobacteriota bacterium]
CRQSMRGAMMRKRILSENAQVSFPPEQDWLDVKRQALVEVTSEDPAHPIESALLPDSGTVWRASYPGDQTIRLLFDQPMGLKRIRLEFHEEQFERSQEFTLRWSDDGGQSYHLLVRQQFNFSPPDTTCEIEDYTVDLDGVTGLELRIVPDISGSNIRASLAGFQLA